MHDLLQLLPQQNAKTVQQLVTDQRQQRECMCTEASSPSLVSAYLEVSKGNRWLWVEIQIAKTFTTFCVIGVVITVV